MIYSIDHKPPVEQITQKYVYFQEENFCYTSKQFFEKLRHAPAQPVATIQDEALSIRLVVAVGINEHHEMYFKNLFINRNFKIMAPVSNSSTDRRIKELHRS